MFITDTDDDWKVQLIVVVLLQTTSILSLTLLCIYITYQLIFPNIIECPWTKALNPHMQKKEKEYTVIFAGSFNPPHNGHLSMIEYLAQRYGKVVLVIGINPTKKYDVNPNNRARILIKMINDCNVNCNNNIQVQVVSDYIWRYAYQIKTKILFRGIRTWKKDGTSELFLLLQNIIGPMLLGFKLPPTLPTIFLQGKHEYNHISSSLIRKICNEAKKDDVVVGDNKSIVHPILDGLVPSTVNDMIYSMYSK